MKLALAKIAAGLVIRTSEVELLARQATRIVSRMRVPIEADNQQSLVRAIQQAVSVASNLNTNRFAVSILTQDIVFRFFTIPAIPKNDWDSAVQFEARKYIPFKIDKLVWDAVVVPSRMPQRLDVIFSAIPREIFDAIQVALKEAGVVPTVIEPRTASLARLVGHSTVQATAGSKAAGVAANTDTFACLVDIDRDTAHLAIVKNRLPYLARDIHLVPSKEARLDNLYLYAGVADPPVQPVVNEPASGPAIATGEGSTGVPLKPPIALEVPQSVDPKIQKLLSELRVSIDFFTREHPSATIEKVWLFGEDSVIGQWQQALSEQLQGTVDVGRSLLNQRFEGGLPVSFASAAGLLEDKEGLSINFLKRSIGKSSGNNLKEILADRFQIDSSRLIAMLDMRQLVVCAAVAVALLVGLWTLGYRRVKEAKQRLQVAIQERQDVGWDLKGKTETEIKPIQENAKAQLALLSQVINGRSQSALVLDQLARSLPDGVWLTSLTFEDQSIKSGKGQFTLIVQGACFLGSPGQEVNAIQAFEDRMKHSPVISYMRNIRVDAINAQVSQNYTYRTFQLQYQSDRMDRRL